MQISKKKIIIRLLKQIYDLTDYSIDLEKQIKEQKELLDKKVKEQWEEEKTQIAKQNQKVYS